MKDHRTNAQLLVENEQLRTRLDEAERTLEAIRSGDVDALVIEGPKGARIFSLDGAEHIYRVIAETMHEAALTVDKDGIVFFCNRRFCDLIKIPMNKAVGRNVSRFVSRAQQLPLRKLLSDVQAGPVQRSLTLRASDGTSVPVQLSASLIHEDSSADICLIASDLKQIEASAKSIRILREHQQELEESEETVRSQLVEIETIYRSAPVGMCVFDRDLRYVRVNDRLAELNGIPREDHLGKTVRDIVPDVTDIAENLAERILRTGKPELNVEFSGTTQGQPDVKRYWLEQWLPLKDSSGEVIAINVVAEETTERRQAEENLRQSEERYRLLFDQMTVGIAEGDIEGRLTAVNPAFCSITGYDEKELIGKNALDLTHPDDVLAEIKLVERLISGEAPSYRIEKRYVRKDGRTVWVDVAATALRDISGKIVRGVVVVQDISERKRSEEAVRNALSKAEEERRVLEAMMEFIPMGITIAEAPDVKIRIVSRFGRELTGKPPEVLEGISVEKHAEAYDVFHSDGVTPANNEELPLTRATQKGEVVGEEVWVLGRSDGTTFPILCTAGPIRDAQGNITGGVIGWQDITGRRKAEEGLAAAHRQVQSIIDNTTSIVYAFDLEGRFLLANTAVAALLNSTPEQMIGKRRHEFMPKDNADWHEANDRRVIEAGNALEFEEYSQLKGRSITWLTTKFPLRDAQGRIYAVGGISADVSVRKRMEEELRRSRDGLELRIRERTVKLEQKNRDLQDFAFMASHDLSEPLRKIQTFGDLLKAKSAALLDEPSMDYISRMSGAAHRMQELLDALLRYSRVETQGRDPVPVSLEETARAVLADLEVSIKKIDAHVEIGSLPIINGDPYQWRQLFQNLLANAVKYHRTEVKTRIRIHGEEMGRQCHIFVEDNGIGFDEKYMDKIFQPFQRLHGRHEYPGTGIGLAICKKIVERHGGTITARGSPGRGSTFIVALPTEKEKK